MIVHNTPAQIMAPQLQWVLDVYKDVFEEPKSLPPQRHLDHTIPLKPNSKLTNVRPYRYPYFQKAKVEKLVREMLEASIIHPIHNPYASLALLVKKKDGIWRFYVDYRGMNDITVKEKFLISIVE